jgi:UDP-N-acetylmuramoyl-L-alanyl-D-glutamate--2,6-diaminopimelate ligase
LKLSDLIKTGEYKAQGAGLETYGEDRGPGEKKAQGARRKATGGDASRVKTGAQSAGRGSEGQGDVEIGSIHYRAQEVLPGGLFVAIRGQSADGHDYVQTAVERGACAVVVQREVDLSPGSDAVVVRVPDTRRALADLAARFYHNPSEHMILVGITGTNGKTTTSYLLESMLVQAGCNVGVIGTINYRYGGRTFTNPVTTPESADLQRILAEMRLQGVSHVILEVSSHAIALHRIQNCWFDVAVFTNLSQDHLDFHGDMAAYWACKKRLFTQYLKTGPKADHASAVINCDDARGQELSAELDLPVITVGRAVGSLVTARRALWDLKGIRTEIVTPAGDLALASPLVGRHNLANLMCAVGVGISLGIDVTHIRAGLEAVAAVPGRLERVNSDTGRFVYVDYAHTPDALDNALATLRAMTSNRLICVFGCGGDRDKAKRPQMGEIAARHSDLCVVTSDNPRREDPMEIIRQIVTGTRRITEREISAAELSRAIDTKAYIVEPDRRRAIELGIRAAGPRDTVLIAGKGHEDYQIVGTEKFRFDDRIEAQKAMRITTNKSSE